MPVDYAAHWQRMLAHYTALAVHPGWKAYAWARVKQMARESPDLYATLPQDLTDAMKGQANADHQL